MAKAVKVVQDLQLEALADILLHSLKAALVSCYMRLHVVVAKAAPVMLEMLQPMRLVAQAAVFGLPVTTIHTTIHVQPF